MRNSGPRERIVQMMTRLRHRISYANVTATLALFVALGGTSYAVVQLPRNSVGSKQIRSGGVGASEIRSGSVRSKDIGNRSIRLGDVSLGARRSLRGQVGPAGPQGPPGPPGTMIAAAITSSGSTARSNGAVSTTHDVDGSGLYLVRSDRDLSSCYAIASLSAVPGGGTTTPENGQITTAISGSSVTVRTRNSSGAAADLPFHVLVSC